MTAPPDAQLAAILRQHADFCETEHGWGSGDTYEIRLAAQRLETKGELIAEMRDAIKAYLDWSTGLNNPQGFCEDTQLRPIRERMRAILDHGLPTAADVRGILKETP